MTRFGVLGFLVMVALACGEGAQKASDTASSAAASSAPQTTPEGRTTVSLNLTSTAFAPNGSIPAPYTCEGDDTSPPLSWAGAPSGTKSVALIVDDPDAPDPAKPQRVYVHWVVYNIPPTATSLPENASKKGLPAGAVQGKNDWGKTQYGGPCPPVGRHRYFFKLYALDTQLTGLSSPTKADLLKAIEGHVIANGELIGTYQKSGASK